MPTDPVPKSVLRLAADGEQADAARRVLLADWLRLVGQRLNGRPVDGQRSDEKAALATAFSPPADAAAPSAASSPLTATTVPSAATAAPAIPSVTPPVDPVAGLNLSPRLEQTLRGLLDGSSEKQIALRLSISPHTVHAYVKQLHKRLGVSSRGELLARFIHRV